MAPKRVAIFEALCFAIFVALCIAIYSIQLTWGRDQPPLSHRSIGSLKSCVTCLSKIYSAHGGLQIDLPVL